MSEENQVEDAVIVSETETPAEVVVPTQVLTYAELSEYGQNPLSFPVLVIRAYDQNIRNAVSNLISLHADTEADRMLKLTHKFQLSDQVFRVAMDREVTQQDLLVVATTIGNYARVARANSCTPIVSARLATSEEFNALRLGLGTDVILFDLSFDTDPAEYAKFADLTYNDVQPYGIQMGFNRADYEKDNEVFIKEVVQSLHNVVKEKASRLLMNERALT